jgi:hypothetical protein
VTNIDSVHLCWTVSIAWGMFFIYNILRFDCTFIYRRFIVILQIWHYILLVASHTVPFFIDSMTLCVESSWNVMAHGDAREGKWRETWRIEWVASTLTLPRNMVHPALLPLMRTHRLPVVYWTDAPADLNGRVRFAERRNLVSARVPSHFKRSLPVASSVRFSYSSVRFQRWKLISHSSEYSGIVKFVQ